jgi:hypothetical protein
MQAIVQENKFVNLLPPKSINGSGHSAAYINTENYQHVTFIVSMGATSSAGASQLITLEQSKSVSGSSSANLPMVNYWTNLAALGDGSIANDTFVKQTAVASSGNTMALDQSTDNVVYVFEIDTRELTDGYPFVGISVDSTTSTATCGVVAILSDARYAQTSPPSVIT